MNSQNMAIVAVIYMGPLPPSPHLCSDIYFFVRQVFIKHLDQVGHEGMLQLVLCRVGMHSVLLDMVRLLSLLLRSVETLSYYNDYLF